MKRLLYLILLLPFLGCSDDSAIRPADMPKLVACTVTVLSEGQPLPGVTVEFHRDDPNFKWSASAVANEKGEANMVTYSRFFGVVEGEYTVTVSKLERETFDPEKPPRQVKVFTLTEAQYIDPKTSPLKIKVSGKTMKSFDVGKTGNNVLRMEDAT